MHVSRRHVLATGSAAAIAASLAASGKAASVRDAPAPPIQMDLSINFDRDDVYKWLSNAKIGDVGEFGPTLSEAEKPIYTPLSTKDAGTTAGQVPNLSLYTATRLHYKVRARKSKKVIGEVTALDIYEHPVLVTAKSVLLVTEDVRKNPALADKIKQAFDAYDPSSNPDPFKYALDKMGNDVTADMFLVRTAFAIKRKENPKINHTQRDQLLAFYKGKVNVKFFDLKYTNLPSYLEDNPLELIGPTEEYLGRVPSPQTDPTHQREFLKPVTQGQEDQAVQDIMDGAKSAMTGCEANVKDFVRIAAVFGWPEFKIEMVDVKIQIGCIWVIFSLPVLRVRFSDLVLFAWILHEANLSKRILQLVEGCVVRSAISATVIGVVLNNFYAALAAYEALFDECVAEQVSCLMPGLALIVESSSWS
jgi:hypothetical protein